MNGREGYITTEITQSRGGSMVARLKLKGIDALGFGGKRKKRAQRKERGSWDARGVGSSHPRAKGPFSLGRLGCSVLCIFHP